MPRALQILVAVIALGVIGWFGFKLFNTPEQAGQRRALDLRELAMRQLGEALNSSHPDAPALILGNPFTQRPNQPAHVLAFEADAVRGFKQGFAGKLEMDWPELSAEALSNPGAIALPPQTRTPLSYLCAPKAWDAVLAKHPGAKIVVSLIGVPADLANHEFWQRTQGVSLALLLPDLELIGNLEAIRTAFAQGKIAAVLLNKPSAPPESAAPAEDAAAEFARRFLLVTPTNLEATITAYPQLFPQ